jgi:MYXO-CTERM domain-containing protein
VDLCGDVQCIEGAFCQNGFCLDCFTVPCPEGEICKPNMNGVGECEVDLCADVTCDTDAGEFCVDGECRTTDCEGGCASDERCVNGVCEDDPCDGVTCPNGRICRATDGECVLDNLCDEVQCFNGEACDPGTGDCISDPCLGIECPEGTGCFVEGPGLGICREPKGDRVYAGGRGSGCAAGGDSGTTSGMLLMLGLFGLIRRRRRRN